MRLFSALLFFGLMVFGIVFFTIGSVNAWMSITDGVPKFEIDGNDTKLMIAWAAIILGLIAFVVSPSSFKPNTGKAPQMTKGQIIAMAIAMPGLLAIPKLLFSDGYLQAAENYGRANGYSVICNEIGYKYGRELVMAKTEKGCEA